MADSPTPKRAVSSRGFIQYDELTDSYGANCRVVESSAAAGPHVWIFVEDGAVKGNNGSAHLDVQQATRVRDALTAWLDEVPERWGE
jgi:hypothetical protein